MGKISLLEVSPLAPLVVDLDGTLTPTDTLVESIFSLLKKIHLICFKFFAGSLLGAPDLSAV